MKILCKMITKEEEKEMKILRQWRRKPPVDTPVEVLERNSARFDYLLEESKK